MSEDALACARDWYGIDDPGPCPSCGAHDYQIDYIWRPSEEDERPVLCCEKCAHVLVVPLRGRAAQ